MSNELRPSQLAIALQALDAAASPLQQLSALVAQGLDDLPLPGGGATLLRWQALARVGEHDLSLAKLFEGHTDALAILAELGRADLHTPGSTWGVWASEAPTGRAELHDETGGRGTLSGGKAWCSGANGVTHGLLTAWLPDGRGPQLVAIDMGQPSVQVHGKLWQAVGMVGSHSLDIRFEGARVNLVGSVDAYLNRPGFWHGGAGVAACWYGGAVAIANALRASVAQSPQQQTGFRLAALGRVDLLLQQTMAVLRDSARWIDANPQADACTLALRARLSAETCATKVLDTVGRALGAAPYCRDAQFARHAADLPVFIRQSHAERDLSALGERIACDNAGWDL